MPTQIELLKKYHLRPRGVRGQNFLIDPNIQRKIVELLNPRPGERILEIGPGLGALTGEVLKRGAHVWAVERDERLVQILEQELVRNYPRTLHLVRGDILKWDPGSLLASDAKNNKIKVVSNLPYYLTTPILFYLADHHDHISKAVLTMQREVAARLVAPPGTKDYGRLTLAFRLYATAYHAFDISPKCFTPQPEVSSSTMVLSFHPTSLLPGPEERQILLQLIETAFSQRRKTLLHLLLHNPAFKKRKEEILKIFRSLELPEKVRGEELLFKDFLALAKCFVRWNKPRRG